MKDTGGVTDTATGDTITDWPTLTTPPQRPTPSTGGGGGHVSWNRPPACAHGDATTRTVADNAAAGRNIGAPLAVVDPDRGDTLNYTLEGEDAGSFDIDASTGQLRTKSALGYETRTSYTLTARAADRRGSWDPSGAIDRDEANAAVVAYFNGAISKEKA
jgi:hypothetical protein